MKCSSSTRHLPRVSAPVPGPMDADGEGNPGAVRRSRQRLLCGCRVDEPADGGDAIGWKACALGVLLDGRLVRSEIDAVHLVAGYITMEPLDLGTHSLQNVDRRLRDFPQLRVG